MDEEIKIDDLDSGDSLLKDTKKYEKQQNSQNEGSEGLRRSSSAMVIRREPGKFDGIKRMTKRFFGVKNAPKESPENRLLSNMDQETISVRSRQNQSL